MAKQGLGATRVHRRYLARAEVSRFPAVAGILLAAGRSQRMLGGPKLLLPLWGRPLVCWAAEALVLSGLEDVRAVLGCEATEVRRALKDQVTRFVENPRHAEGMATSIAAGVAALEPQTRAVVIALGDMPCVSPLTVRSLAQTFERGGMGIVVPVHGKRRGHPVLFDLTSYRQELLSLSGDTGARSILDAHPEDVLELSVEDPGILADVDSPSDYESMRRSVTGNRSTRRCVSG